ncbi:hypothetical protein MWU76_04100 [Gelidibacter sp. F2691]|nr:hypothetical protein [Gelidibacter sp. F2691]
MKYILSLVFVFSFLACKSEKHRAIEASDAELPNSDLYEPLESEAASDDENYQAALDFLNAYIENKDTLEILEFVKASPLATENLKTALETILIEAWEENPTVGLGFDPLFDAQDYPDKGVILHSFDPETGYVMAKGVEWTDFRVVLRVVNEDGHILVDGCGVVNIPEEKRAER